MRQQPRCAFGVVGAPQEAHMRTRRWNADLSVRIAAGSTPWAFASPLAGPRSASVSPSCCSAHSLRVRGRGASADSPCAARSATGRLARALALATPRARGACGTARRAPPLALAIPAIGIWPCPLGGEGPDSLFWIFVQAGFAWRGGFSLTGRIPAHAARRAGL